MNGWPDRALLAIAGAAISFLLALGVMLVGVILTMHEKRDAAREAAAVKRDAEVWIELTRFRDRLHDIMADISKWKIETLKERE